MAGVQCAHLAALISILINIVYGVQCPSECRCSLDDTGRKKVACLHGGLRSTAFISNMDVNTQVLIISGHPEKLNYLNLGPIFKNLRGLEEIHIIWSGIPNIGAHSFWGLSEVKVLNLTHNSLSTLMDSNFKGLTSLKQLDLSHNGIESVPSAVFRFVRHLTYLNLSHNKIFSLVTRIFFGLTRLDDLDLSNNPIGHLQPELFSDVPVLKKLLCASCGLRNISDGIFSRLTEVTHLDIRNNFLVKLPKRVSILNNLEKLMLDGNQIPVLEDRSFSGSTLTSLSLSYNKISFVEPKTFHNSSVTRIDLSYNQLVTLQTEGFNEVLPQLLELKLNGNPLIGPQLNLLFENTKQLTHLGLGEVGLTRIPDIARAPNLRSLNFSSNLISNLPEFLFFATPNLNELDVSFNQLEEVHEQVLSRISMSKTLRVIRLEGNPWKCDRCHIVPMLKWLQESPDQESGCSEPQVWSCVKCATPPAVANHPLALLPAGDLPKCLLDITTTTEVNAGMVGGVSVKRYHSLSPHAASNGSNVDYIDKLDELKVAPSLADKSVFPANKITKSDKIKHNNNDDVVVERKVSLPLLVTLLSVFFISLVVLIMLCGARRNSKRLMNVNHNVEQRRENSRIWKVFQRKGSDQQGEDKKEMETGSGLEPSYQPRRGSELSSPSKKGSESHTPPKGKVDGAREVTEQMTELKLDKDLSESFLKASFATIRETELL